MDLSTLFEKRLRKIESLSDFIILYGKKVDSIVDLREISNEIDEIKELLQSCSELLNKFQTENKEKCKRLIETAQTQQLIMLDVLEQVMDSGLATQPQPSQKMPTPAKSDGNNRPVNVLNEISNITITPCKFGSFKPGEQPLVSFADYVKSPYTTKRMRPLALQFIDFEKTISNEEFTKIPGYELFCMCSNSLYPTIILLNKYPIQFSDTCVDAKHWTTFSNFWKP